MATLCFDLDGTLCTATDGDYDRAEPYDRAIERVNRLSRAGNRIIIWTARGTATGIDWESVTRAQLERWGIAFDELRFGKPSADVFIDDRAVHADGWRLGDGLTPPALAPFLRPPGHCETTVVIPARLRSSRLPRKVLADIDGRTMLERVHDVAIRAQCGPVVVLTDDDEVAEVVRCFGGEVWLTDAGHESGTARIASVAARLSGEVVVNLQGDAPLIDPAVVARTAEEAAGSGAAVTMPVYPLRDEADVLDPNVVKVVRGRDGRVLYCSRSAIPFRRDGGASYWGHAGLYAYTRAFLEAFESLPASELEDAERLEQLRWLEAGVRAHSFAVDYQQPSVDTAADLERIRSLLAGTKAVPV